MSSQEISKGKSDSIKDLTGSTQNLPNFTSQDLPTGSTGNVAAASSAPADDKIQKDEKDTQEQQSNSVDTDSQASKEQGNDDDVEEDESSAPINVGFKIGTFCEGPNPSFARGLIEELPNFPHDRLILVSDLEDGFCDQYRARGIQAPTLVDPRDATNPASYEGIDIACVICPYGPSVSVTQQLCRDIVRAVAQAAQEYDNFRYLIFGARQQDQNPEPKYGLPVLYGFFPWNQIAIFRPEMPDRRQLSEDYMHVFTAGEKTIRDTDWHLKNFNAYFYLTIFDLGTNVNPAMLQPSQAVEVQGQTPIRAAMSLLHQRHP